MSKDYMKESVQEQDGTPEILAEAKELIEKVEDYKPLAKVEEQLEENYNHIDNMLNNLKKPSEERVEEAQDLDTKQDEALAQADSDSGRKTDMEKPKKSKRPSLKKRLEEKKEQVAAQPEKPAPEKEKVKSNGRGLNDE